MSTEPSAFITVAGVTPCPAGWAVLPARMAGVTLVAEAPLAIRKLIDVLDYRPRFDFAAFNIPFAYPDEPGTRWRRCDYEARKLVGWPHRVNLRPVPSRQALFAPDRDAALALDPWLTRNDFRRFPRMREAATEIQPFHSRTYFSGSDVLSFTHMNGDVPLTTSPHHEDGQVERLALLKEKMPGVDEVILRTPPAGVAQFHLLQAAAMLWTARRASGKAIARLPLDPEWDAGGARIEIVR